MTKTNIGLSHSQTETGSIILKGILSDEVVLQAKTRSFHWNVTGMHFSQLHTFFESQYDQLGDYIDDTAERIRQLGLATPGNLSDFLSLTRLKEASGSLTDRDMLSQLLNDHETIIKQLRVDIDATTGAGDAGNSDFLTALLEGHEKMAWMLRSYLS